MKYLIAFCVVACLSGAITLTVLISGAVKENAPTIEAVAEDNRYEAHWLFMRECLRKNYLKACENAK